MATGKVKFYSVERGFGFVKNDEPGPDLFLHYSEVGDVELDDGQRLQFDIEANTNHPDKFRAVNVKVLQS